MCYWIALNRKTLVKILVCFNLVIVNMEIKTALRIFKAFIGNIQSKNLTNHKQTNYSDFSDLNKRNKQGSSYLNIHLKRECWVNLH